MSVNRNTPEDGTNCGVCRLKEEWPKFHDSLVLPAIDNGMATWVSARNNIRQMFDVEIPTEEVIAHYRDHADTDYGLDDD